jgi:acetyltransferase
MSARPDLDPLFAPDSVAVVGASPDSFYTSNLIDNLLDFGYDGDLYLVNPGREEAWGRPCYDDIDDVPEVVDLAVVSVPREYVVDVVASAGERGVPTAMVITAGFSEADDTGVELEADLAAAAADHDIRVMGPNCIGLANSHAETVLTATCSRKPDPGAIGLASHSGALAFTTFFERAADEDVAFAHIVSTGNEADQSLTDYVEYMADQGTVDVVCCYIEGLDDARRFADVARAATAAGTPVLAVKIGSSEVAQAAAASHTGSLTGSDEVWDAALRQAGVQRLDDIPDLLGGASVLDAFDPAAGPDVCIASTSGGLATHLADLADERGLSLPQLSDDVEQSLLDMEDLLTFGELHNPADIRGYGADVLPQVAERLFADDAFDAYLFAVGLSAVDDRASEVADAMIEVAETADDPVVYLWTGRKEPADLPDPQPYERVRESVPLFYEPDRAVGALATLVEAGAARERVRADPFDVGAPRGPDLDAGVATWAEATDLLGAYGVDTVETRLATTEYEAASHAAELGFPVVLKVDSPDVPHRNRADAVRVGLDSEAAVLDAYAEIRDNVRAYDPDADVKGVLVQPMVESGVEALVGVSHDDDFGPVVTVGSGGTLVEVIDDAAHLVTPFSAADARAAVERTALPDLLSEAGVDAVEDLVALLERVGELAATREDVAELDLNPVVCTERGVRPVDALVRGE